MPTLSIEEVQSRLPEIIDQLHPGEELVITKADKPVARLRTSDFPAGIPIYGRGKGKLHLDLNDDEHLKDFTEYMS